MAPASSSVSRSPAACRRWPSASLSSAQPWASVRLPSHRPSACQCAIRPVFGLLTLKPEAVAAMSPP